MTQQEKLDNIIRGLFSFYLAGNSNFHDIGGILRANNELINTNDIDILGSRLESEGLIKGNGYKGGYAANLTSKGVEYAEKLAKQSKQFNVYMQVDNGSFNLFNINLNQLDKVTEAYKKGLNSISINHRRYSFKSIEHIAILENEKNVTAQQLEEYADNGGDGSFGHQVLDPETLVNFGPDVTFEYLLDELYGYEKMLNNNPNTDYYIDLNRIEELNKINNPNFDLSKLIRICEELNDNYRNKNYFTVGLLLRTIINHVPPIFNYTIFDQVIGGYGGPSFKKNMKSLNDSLRSTADSYTHQLIRKKEPLPNLQQVDYKGNIDTLLSEILVLLHA